MTWSSAVVLGLALQVPSTIAQDARGNFFVEWEPLGADVDVDVLPRQMGAAIHVQRCAPCIIIEQALRKLTSWFLRHAALNWPPTTASLCIGWQCRRDRLARTSIPYSAAGAGGRCFGRPRFKQRRRLVRLSAGVLRNSFSCECMQLLLTHAKIKPESCFFPACRSRPEAAYDSFLTVGPTDGGTHSDDIPTMIG